MSIVNVKKEAGILEHIPFTQDYGKSQLSKGSPSYKTALSLLNNLHRCMGQCISVQKEHLQRVIKFGKAMRLQDFARHVDGFLKEQSKITYVVTDSKLRASFDELLGSIEGELYGKHVPFPSENIVSEITATTSIPSSLTNPPSFDWVSTGKAYIAARQKKQKAKDDKTKASQKAASNKAIESYLTKEALFGNWYKNNYYGNLQRGQSLKGGIEQITDILTNLYASNKEQYRVLKSSIAKGDPDEYYDNLKQLTSTTNIAISQIIKPWDTHFAKYTTEQESTTEEPNTEHTTEQTEMPAETTEDLPPVDTTKEHTTEVDELLLLNEVEENSKDETEEAPKDEVEEGSKVESPKEDKPISGMVHEVDLTDLEEPTTIVPAKEVAQNKPKQRKQKKAEYILENIYKAASTGDQYLVAHYIVQLAEEINEDDEDLADSLTNIAQEAFDNG